MGSYQASEDAKSKSRNEIDDEQKVQRSVE